MKNNSFKKSSLALCAVLLTAALLAGCSNTSASESNGTSNPVSVSTPSAAAEQPASVPVTSDSATEALPNLQVTFNDAEYTMVYYPSTTAEYLVNQIPSLSMLMPPSYDMDGLYKYYDMPRPAPANEEEITSVSAGEVLMDGTDRLILYYQDAEITGSYTRVGYFTDTTGLAEALGDGDVQFRVTKVDPEN